jgi:hypothetical protein
MAVAEVIAEPDKVVGYFKCSGTHEREWHGIPATGRHFADIDEIYVFRVERGKLDSALAVVEDNLGRMRQLGVVGLATSSGRRCTWPSPAAQRVRRGRSSGGAAVAGH